MMMPGGTGKGTAGCLRAEQHYGSCRALGPLGTQVWPHVCQEGISTMVYQRRHGRRGVDRGQRSGSSAEGLWGGEAVSDAYVMVKMNGKCQTSVTFQDIIRLVGRVHFFRRRKKSNQ